MKEFSSKNESGINVQPNARLYTNPYAEVSKSITAGKITHARYILRI